ncbi:MAG: hypothetical protein LQ345_005008 [Seirophora villosa]|nr:MAG: hypothetical protein LQ345_005008 [Seirophora villosa]
MDQQPDYSGWSSEKLVERVTVLERQLREQMLRYGPLSKPSSAESKPKKLKSTRQFDPCRYSTRFIALKFAYLGRKYNGLEHHANNPTPYPTIEEELWKALSKAKLIFPTPRSSLDDEKLNWEGCEYSKCGRTDKGVSAFGQVISLRIRSNRPLPMSKSDEAHNNAEDQRDTEHELSEDEQASPAVTPFNPIKDEITYPQILNRLLPPEIRILAWCPSPPTDFSARFSCTERSYTYLFTQPAYTPTPGLTGILPARTLRGQRREGWLDIAAMKEAAKKFEGPHDFRNFCKVDPSKQIENFQRLITFSDITRVRPTDTGPAGYLDLSDFRENHPPDMDGMTADPLGNSYPPSSQTQPPPVIHAFEVRGSGFLWHQVRHMVAILFLIGQGLEKPSLIDDLLDIEKTPQKPVYDMADAAPLVLKDCKFEPELQWIHIGENTGDGSDVARNGLKGDGKHGIGGAVDELWRVWRGHKIDETLAGSLLGLVARGDRDDSTNPNQVDHSRSEADSKAVSARSNSQRVFLGGDLPRHVGKYIPVLARPRMETVEVVNAKYLKRKGLDLPERNGEKAAAVDDGCL